MNQSFLSLAELAEGLKKKEFSSVELTEFFLKRLDTLGRSHNAVASTLPKIALEQAKASDARRAAGTTKGLLDGIPFGAKDLLSWKGTFTTWGSPGHLDQSFDVNATVLTRLVDNGAVLLAKLAMIELAGGGNYNVANASATGPCASAFDKGRWAGGSSSGSGAATALGCVPYSLGSETAGSIVCPSAFNGLTGIRPTYGRVSRHGAMALAWTLDRLGPMARSVADALEVYRAIEGPDPSDATTLGQPRSNDAKPVRTIGVLKEEFAKNSAKECERAYKEALAAFEKLGYKIVEIKYPQMPYMEALSIIVQAEQASAHENFIRGPRLKRLADQNQVAGLSASLLTPATDYLWALRVRSEFRKADQVWEKCDAIFTPTFYHAAPPIDKPFDQTFNNMGGDEGPSNLLGWPAIAFPIGFEDGSPLGGTLMGPTWTEESLAAVVAKFQDATDIHRVHPKV